MTSTDTTQREPDSYSDALVELESIVANLERGVDDVDSVADAAERAMWLTAWCRNRLTSAEQRLAALTVQPAES